MGSDFTTNGYAGPVPIFSRTESHRFLRELLVNTRDAPLDWEKGWAPASRPYFALACHPAILCRLREWLGPDVLLWGAMLIHKNPGVVHAWHTDLESSDPNGKTVTVWLALKDCTPESSLQVIPGSHLFGQTVQEVRAADGMTRGDSGPEDALRWAQQRDANSQLMTLATSDGEAVFFDGRLWHGTDNTSTVTRTALLLQYATPETSIRIPMNFDWPYETLPHPLPPCVLVSGEDHHQVNRIVPGPTASGSARGPRLTSQARPLELPLALGSEPWKPFPIFHGTTAGQRELHCHISALAPGHSPHPPHRHDEEELLMVLSGSADVVLPDLAEDQQRQRLSVGDCVYYPANFAHTLEGVGDEPVNYLMLKWLADPTECTDPLGFQRFSFTAANDENAGPGFQITRQLDGPTAWLHKLHCHTSAMEPGAGYEPHVDGYDVVMIVLDGELESLGQTLTPHGVYFYAAGEPHGAHNPGNKTAHYVVFEFHAHPTVASDQPPHIPYWRKLADPRRWRRRIRNGVQRLGRLLRR
ncbi:MAG: cupin domain-containing protein [Planctomycetota bacterium]